jgi:outer membrane protein assembly factor BamB
MRRTTKLTALTIITLIALTQAIQITNKSTTPQNTLNTGNETKPERRQAPPTITMKWNYTMAFMGFSDPGVGDVDGDGQLEVIVTSSNNRTYCLNAATGSIERFYYTDGVLSPPVIVDFDGDGQLDIAVGAHPIIVDIGNVYCINGASGLFWQDGRGGWVYASPCVYDVDGDGKAEMIFGNFHKYVYCVNDTNGFSGTVEWYYTAGGAIYTSPGVADLDGDGKVEVVVGTGDGVYCLNGSTGAKEWSYITGSWGRPCPYIADVDGDGQLEVLIGKTGGKLYCLSGTGRSEWNYTTKSDVTSPCVADIDNDGQLEVLVGSGDKNVYCLNGATGGKEWNYTTGGFVQSSACVADIDGDGQLEVLVGSDDGKLYCLSGTGRSEWNYTADGYIGSPCVVDVDGDGRLEVLFSADVLSGPGSVYCLSVDGTPMVPGAYPWPSICFGGGIRHTGCFIDSDGDGLTDAYEATVGTNPLCGDTDTDGLSDYVEFLSSTDPFADYNPPATIVDLGASDPTGTSIRLTWTAPGDNGASGNASGYWVKYSTSGAITDANWDSATNYTQTWTPLSAGSAESHVITGLNSTTQYWFAIKAYDEVPNISGISNVVNGTPASQHGTPADYTYLAVVVGILIATIAVVLVIANARKRKR